MCTSTYLRHRLPSLNPTRATRRAAAGTRCPRRLTKPKSPHQTPWPLLSPDSPFCRFSIRLLHKDESMSSTRLTLPGRHTLASGQLPVLVSFLGCSFGVRSSFQVNGIPKGTGSGGNKQIAKEEAARAAYYSMGWT